MDMAGSPSETSKDGIRLNSVPRERHNTVKHIQTFQDASFAMLTAAHEKLCQEHEAVIAELHANLTALQMENDKLRGSVIDRPGKTDGTGEQPTDVVVRMEDVSGAESDDRFMFGICGRSGEQSESWTAIEICEPADATGGLDPTSTRQSQSGYRFEVLPAWADDNSVSITMDFEEATKEFQSRGATYDTSFRGFLERGMSMEVHHLMHPKWMLSPLSTRRLWWDLMAAVVLGYDLWVIPISVFNPPEDGPFFVLAAMVMIFWTMDLVATFFVGYHDEEGEMVMDHRMIARRYLRGWFSLDIIVIATDWLSTGVRLLGGDGDVMENMEGIGLARLGKLARVFRMLRLVRLLRFRKLRPIAQRLHDNVDVEYLAILLAIVKNLSLIIAINHGLACAWYWIGSETAFSGKRSWTTVYPANTWITNYLRAALWCISNFTPGSSGISPVNNFETGFAVVVLFFALAVFSVFVSSTTSLISRLVTLQSSQSKQLWVLKGYLRQHHFPRELKERVIRYVNIALGSRQEMIHRSDVPLLNLLSEPLREEIQTNLHKRTLTQHPLFKLLNVASPHLLRKMCVAALSEMGYSRGDMMFSIGETMEKMFFVVTGVLVYTAKGSSATLHNFVSSGEYICEAALWTKWLSRGMMAADVDCEAVAIGAEAFSTVMRRHYVEVTYVKRYAAAFVETLNQRGELEPSALSDLQADVVTDRCVLDVLAWNRKASGRSTPTSGSGSLEAPSRRAQTSIRSRSR